MNEPPSGFSPSNGALSQPIVIRVYGTPGPQGSWKIYALRGGGESSIRYIGITIQSMRSRLIAHIRRSITENTHKDRWIRSLPSKSGVLSCEILEFGNGEGWAEAEMRWIAKMRADGHDLTNTTVGGEGCRGYRHSDEMKKSQSERQLGKSHSDESKAKISASLAGRRKSVETRTAMRGRRVSVETRRRQSDAQKGHPVSAETLLRMSAARKGKPISDAARASRPKNLSAEHRSAISAGLRRCNRWNK